MVLRPENVEEKWRHVARVLIGLVGSVVAIYMCFKVYRVVDKGEEVSLDQQPNFGRLPDFELCTLHAPIEFGSYFIGFADGMELSSSPSEVEVSITEEAGSFGDEHCIIFGTSKVQLKSLTRVVQFKNKRVKPVPSVSLQVFYHKQNAPGWFIQGLYMYAKYESDGTFGTRRLQMGSKKGSKLGVQHQLMEYVVELDKQREKWTLTGHWQHDTDEGANVAAALLMDKDKRFGFDSLYINDYVEVPCEGSYQPGPNCKHPIGGHNTTSCGTCSENGTCSGAPSQDPPGNVCSAKWDTVYVTVLVNQETVPVICRHGVPLMLLHLVSTAGGLLSIVSAALACIFVKKHTSHPVVLLNEERTFLLDSSSGGQEPPPKWASIQEQEGGTCHPGTPSSGTSCVSSGGST